MGERYYVPGGVTTGEDVGLGALQLLGQIGSGGQGRVHELGNSDKLVYKEYYNPKLVRTDAMMRLVRLRQQRQPAERSWLDAHFAWPMCRVVSGDGTVVGFIMRRVSRMYSWRDAAGKQRLTELQFLVRPPKPRWQQITQPSPDQRRRLARALAELTQRLHRWDVVFGDISDANILWTVKPQPDVYVIDCDGMRIRGNEPILDQADTPGWHDPRQRSPVPGVDADLYKTALGITRILCCDPEVKPRRESRFLDGTTPLKILEGTLGHREAEVRRLLDQSAGPAGRRPDAALWVAALAD
jgi:hypothetical protein